MATPEELERIRQYEAWLAEQENKDKTTRVNPFDTGDGAERAQNREDRRIGRMDWNSLMRFMEQNQEDQFNRVKDVGGFGGIRKSDKNPGRSDNAGIDWLKKHYNPAANPAEGRNVQADAAGAVANAKLEQGQRRQNEAMQLAQDGTLTRNVGGASLTDFFGANRGDVAAAHAFGAGASPAQGGGPDFSVLNIPDQYGGGFGYASQKVPLPTADPSLLLPTGGYNAAMGVGGSGVPMSAGEAASVGNLGNGIYAPRDASDPSSQDAIMARRALAQGGIKQRTKEFYENPFIPTSVQAQPKSNLPNMIMAQPGLPTPRLTSDEEQRVQARILYQASQQPAGQAPLPPAQEIPIPWLQDWMSINDRLGEKLANPMMEYLTGKQEVYPSQLLQRLVSSLFR